MRGIWTYWGEDGADGLEAQTNLNAFRESGLVLVLDAEFIVLDENRDFSVTDVEADDGVESGGLAIMGNVGDGGKASG